MSRRTLDDLKANIKKIEEKKTSYDNYQNRDTYPFWNMEVGQHAKIRLLEDANLDNPYIFFAEKLTHELSIAGKTRKIACLTQYGESCPICELSRAYYKQEGNDSKNGKYYYRRKSAIVRVLVLEDPLPPDAETGETFRGKVVKTFLGNQLLKKMLAQMNDKIDPMNGTPWDIKAGNDFIIRKDKDGPYFVYDLNSKFISTVSPIPDEYLPLVEEEVDLSTFLPPNPGLEKVEKFLAAHHSGESLDDEHDGDVDPEGNTTTVAKKAETKTTAPAPAPVKEEVVVEKSVSTETPVTESNVMADIRARFKK